MSNLERGSRLPSAESLIACCVLFGVSAPKLFPRLYSHIEEEVLANAATLLDELEGDTSLRSQRKRELLSAALRRAITSSQEGV